MKTREVGQRMDEAMKALEMQALSAMLPLP